MFKDMNKCLLKTVIVLFFVNDILFQTWIFNRAQNYKTGAKIWKQFISWGIYFCCDFVILLFVQVDWIAEQICKDIKMFFRFCWLPLFWGHIVLFYFERVQILLVVEQFSLQKNLSPLSCSSVLFAALHKLT